MATRSDASEPQVDELRRRARRRLVGAIVLALAAAVLLPLLLESEPKPLGDDVSIQIPPIDSGKFINPLSSAKAPDPKLKASAAGGSAGATEPPAASLPGATSPAPAPAPKPSTAEGEAPAPSAAPTVAPTTGNAQVAAAEGKSAAALPPASNPGTDATANSPPAQETTAKAESAKNAAAYVVQIAAFSDHYGANALAAKLKRGGFPGYTEAVTTDKGTTLHRVRVGPYASREAADAALAKLKAAGFTGLVAHVG